LHIERDFEKENVIIIMNPGGGGGAAREIHQKNYYS